MPLVHGLLIQSRLTQSKFAVCMWGSRVSIGPGREKSPLSLILNDILLKQKAWMDSPLCLKSDLTSPSSFESFISQPHTVQYSTGPIMKSHCSAAPSLLDLCRAISVIRFQTVIWVEHERFQFMCKLPSCSLCNCSSVRGWLYWHEYH